MDKNALRAALSRLHDMNLYSLAIEDKRLLLQIRDFESPQEWSIEIPNVSRLRIDNFLEGNIIFEVNFLSSELIQESQIEKLLGEIPAHSREALNIEMTQISEKCLSFLELTCSYGCELLCLFQDSIESISVSPIAK